MLVDAILCPKCDKTVWSRHRHDCRSCPCGYCYIDGGTSYTRVGWGGPEWPEPWDKPEIVKLEIDDKPK